MAVTGKLLIIGLLRQRDLGSKTTAPPTTMLILTFTHEVLVGGYSLPLFLNKSRTASFTLGPTSVMVTLTEQLVWLSCIPFVTSLSMTIADTTSSNGNIFDTVEILWRKKKAMQCV